MKTNRRTTFLICLALAAATPAPREALAADDGPAGKPNIILFITDDQDKPSLGAYGGTGLTPNLDRMAREGMVFHRAYVSSTVCTPSRYSFLTGRYAGRSTSPMYTEACPPGSQGFPSFNVELEEDNANVGAVLRSGGYATGYVGKFHVGPELKRPEQLAAQGLRYVAADARPDDWAATAAFRHNERWYRDFLNHKGFSWTKNIYWGNLQKPFGHHNSDWTIDAALEFIQRNKDRPFYLHYCTTLVHGPDGSWRNSLDHPRVSGEGLLEEPPPLAAGRTEILRRLEEAGLDPMQGHAGYTWVDDGVGAILDKLEDLQIARNTLIVFIADHGSNMKASLFDVDGTCVPCIVRWPAGIQAGAQCHELIQNIDFAPTFFDLAGAEVPEDYLLDGRSLRPLFGGDEPRPWRDHLYFEMGAARAVCTEQWKYIAVRYAKEQTEAIATCSPDQLPRNMAYIRRTGIGTRGSSNPNFFHADQLYNLKDDPRELRNLAADPKYRQPLEKMRTLLTADLQSLGRPFGEFVPGGDAVEPGSIDPQLQLIRKIRIQGKEIILPDGLTPDAKLRDPNGQRRAEREKRRESRRAARP